MLSYLGKKEFGRTFLEVQLFPTCDKTAVFTRPVFATIPSLPEPEVGAPCKKLRTSVFANHWKQVVTTVDVASWSESQEAKLDTAIKRWYDLVLRFPYGIAIKDQIFFACRCIGPVEGASRRFCNKVSIDIDQEGKLVAEVCQLP